MRVLSARERGDMAEQLIPEAAGLVMDVHEGTQQLITERLHSLDRHQLEGLAVVLAALVDPDRALLEALGWINFDEYGQRLDRQPVSVRTVRDAVIHGPATRTRAVDEVAVERALRGDRTVALSSKERTYAVDLGLRRGMGYDNVAFALGMEREAVKRSWERLKDRARAEGRPVPKEPVDEIRQAV